MPTPLQRACLKVIQAWFRESPDAVMAAVCDMLSALHEDVGRDEYDKAMRAGIKQKMEDQSA